MRGIIYEGPSLIDGSPIVVIVTSDSKNSKTGDMMQSWVLRADIDPLQANRTGADYSICGQCIHRGMPTDRDNGQAKDRSCYVALHHAPLSVFKAYKRGSYSHIDPVDAGSGQYVRLGSYGDPAAVPTHIWQALTSRARGRTGYTHRWFETYDAPTDLCMASADSIHEARRAWSEGLRTFRVVRSVDDIDRDNEVLCPASEEAGKKVTCEDCRLCTGQRGNVKSVAIPAHGAGRRNSLNILQ